LSVADLQGDGDADGHAKGTSYHPHVEGPENENGPLNPKADLDCKMYTALVECIRHHQQILLYVYTARFASMNCNFWKLPTQQKEIPQSICIN